MKIKSFNFTSTLLSSCVAVVVLILAMMAVDLGSKQARAISSFGQNRSAENQNNKPHKQVELLLPREPSIGLPRTRGGVNPSGTSHLAKGESEYRAGRHAAAVPELKRAVKEDPKSYDSHYVLALALTETGELRAAIEEFEKAIEVAPKDDAKILAHYNAGNAYSDLGEHAKAIESYKQSIKLDQTLSKLHYNLGLAYAALGRLAEAQSEFAEAVRLKPDYAEAHFNLSVAYWQLGKKREAQEQQRILLKLKPDLATKLEALIRQ